VGFLKGIPLSPTERGKRNHPNLLFISISSVDRHRLEGINLHVFNKVLFQETLLLAHTMEEHVQYSENFTDYFHFLHMPKVRTTFDPWR
jgi:hypothetical protein